MRFQVDTEAERLAISPGGAGTIEHDLYSPEGFAALSELWVAVG